MNYKRLKVLGTGMFGTTYLIKINNKNYALKTQHILPSHRKKDFKYELWRELDLYKYIGKLNKNDKKFFTQLYDYKIYNNCKHKQKRPFKLIDDDNNEFTKKLKKLDKSPWCVDLLIDYHGKWTLGKYLVKHSITEKQCYSLLVQIMKIVHILQKGGYSHNDLHLENVMVIPTKDKYFSFKNKKIPYRGLQIIAIDYGEVLHEKFKIKYRKWEKLFEEDNDRWHFEELKPTLYLIIDNFDKYIYNCKKQKKKMPWERKKDMYNYFIRSIITKHTKLWNQCKKEFINDENTRKIIDKVEKQTDQTIDNILSKSKQNAGAWTLINNCSGMFRALHPILHAKYLGWCSYHKLNIKTKDYITIIKTKNMNQLKKFILSKV